MRSTLLTADNRVQWTRLLEIVEATAKGEDTAAAEKESGQATGEVAALAAAASEVETESKRQATEAAKAQAMNDAVGSLLGSLEGSALRRALRDVDSTDLLLKLVSREGRQLRHAAALAVCGSFAAPWKAKASLLTAKAAGDPARVVGLLSKETHVEAGPSTDVADSARPVSRAALLLRQRQARWKRKVAVLLVATHLQRQLMRGRRGALAIASLFYLSLRICVGALRQAVLQVLPSAWKGGQMKGRDDAPPTADAVAT